MSDDDAVYSFLQDDPIFSLNTGNPGKSSKRGSSGSKKQKMADFVFEDDFDIGNPSILPGMLEMQDMMMGMQPLQPLLLPQSHPVPPQSHPVPPQPQPPQQPVPVDVQQILNDPRVQLKIATGRQVPLATSLWFLLLLLLLLL
jgi:hypothetical protein